MGFYDLTNFAARLRSLRKQTGLNQTDFASVGGVGLGSQSKYERGDTEPGAAYLAALAEQGHDVAYLLTGRAGSDLLDAPSSELLAAFSCLTSEQQAKLLAFVQSIVEPPL